MKILIIYFFIIRKILSQLFKKKNLVKILDSRVQSNKEIGLIRIMVFMIKNLILVK